MEFSAVIHEQKAGTVMATLPERPHGWIARLLGMLEPEASGDPTVQAMVKALQAAAAFGITNAVVGSVDGETLFLDPGHHEDDAQKLADALNAWDGGACDEVRVALEYAKGEFLGVVIITVSSVPKATRTFLDVNVAFRVKTPRMMSVDSFRLAVQKDSLARWRTAFNSLVTVLRGSLAHEFKIAFDTENVLPVLIVPSGDEIKAAADAFEESGSTVSLQPLYPFLYYKEVSREVPTYTFLDILFQLAALNAALGQPRDKYAFVNMDADEIAIPPEEEARLRQALLDAEKRFKGSPAITFSDREPEEGEAL